jgi:hypothetical protein
MRCSPNGNLSARGAGHGATQVSPIPKLRDSLGRNPSPGSLLSPPSPHGRGLKSISVDGPLPWVEGGPQPALSSAGAGRVRGYSRKTQTPVPFSRFFKAAKSDSTSWHGNANSNSEFGVSVILFRRARSPGGEWRHVKKSASEKKLDRPHCRAYDAAAIDYRLCRRATEWATTLQAGFGVRRSDPLSGGSDP